MNKFNKVFDYIEQHNQLKKVLLLFGIAYATKFVYNSLKTIYFPIRDIFQPTYNLIERYGNNSYALITGCTEGIGKGFALYLARIGFNLILIARNQEKLNNLEKEIQKINSQIKIKSIVKDFSLGDNKQFYDDIYQDIIDLDVSILVNNVGQTNEIKHFKDIDGNTIKNILVVNIFSQVFMTKILINKMLQRSKKSAIITLSSVTATHPCGNLSLYCPSKAFNDNFSRCLDIENYNDKIDVLSIKAGGVSTPMLNNYRSFFTLMPEQFVQSTLSYLGKSESTYGHWKHRFTDWITYLGNPRKMYMRKMIFPLFLIYDFYKPKAQKK